MTKRAKWRFQAKHYYKLLCAVSENPSYYEVAGELLDRLYRTFCYGAQHQIVRSSNLFDSTKIDQANFLDRLLTIQSRILPVKDFVRFGIHLLTIEATQFPPLDKKLIQIFVDHLQTTDMRELSIATCEQLIITNQQNQELALKKIKPSEKSFRTHVMRHAQKITSTITEIHLFCCRLLYEYQRGITFYKNNYKTDGNEIYVLLEFLQWFDQKELWIQEYEAAQKIGIGLKSNLIITYNSLKKHKSYG